MDNNANNRKDSNGNRNLKELICSPVGKAGLIFILYVVIFSLILLLSQLFEGGGIGFAILMVLFIYFGWNALNRLTPDIFLIMPVGGWVIYYIVKLLLAAVIGIFVAPFVIAKKITAVIQQNIE